MSRGTAVCVARFAARACVVGFCVAAGPLRAQPAQVNEIPAAQLKRLSLEELMTMDVTSVSKAPEPLALAPAAIQVVTGEDIHQRRAEHSRGAPAGGQSASGANQFA